MPVFLIKKETGGFPLVGQWLKVWAPSAGGTGLILGQGIEILHAMGVAKINFKKRKETLPAPSQ